MAGYAFFFPPQPDNENAVKELKLSYFTDNDQLQQHSSFLALQAASTDQDSLAYTHTVLPSSQAHDHPGVSSHAACSSDCFEAYHMRQPRHDHPHHQHADCNNHRKHLHLLDEHHTCDKLKAEIVAHPLFENLLQAHVQCLAVGVSSQHMQATEAQLGRGHGIATKYLVQGKKIDENTPAHCRREIDAFVENYLQLLLSWKKLLEGLVIPPTMEALSTLSEIEHAFYDLTGVLSNEISNGLMRIDEEWENMCLDTELDASDSEMKSQSSIDRCLFEHVQMELKNKLKDKYQECIQAMRKEIVRKRQAGKLPGDTTALKKWWNAHSRCPYPTEQEKKKLVQETGLEMSQINNWFINHRKRNWADRQSPLPPLQLPLSSNAASAGSSSLQHLPPTLYS